MRRDAHITEDGLFRTWLTRQWEDAPALAMIMAAMNPSTADHEIDDPTIRRDIGFAKREGCGILLKVNLYEFRATDPMDVWKAKERRAPHYFERLEEIWNTKPCPAIFVVAWGVNALQPDADKFVAWAQDLNIPLWCLGKTISGAPRHPLYLKANTPLERFA